MYVSLGYIAYHIKVRENKSGEWPKWLYSFIHAECS